MVTPLVACKLKTDKSYDSKFTTNVQESPVKDWLIGRQQLIYKVHKDKWRIKIAYANGTYFTAEQKTKQKTKIEEIIRIWLFPLRKYSGKPIVDKFEFVETEKKPNPGDTGGSIFHDKGMDLGIIFEGNYSGSHTLFHLANRDNLGCIIRVTRRIKNETHTEMADGYSWYELLILMGRAFGLRSTFGRQPVSVMNGQFWSDEHIRMSRDDTQAALNEDNIKDILSKDDIEGVKWLYRYHVLKRRNKKDCPTEYEWDSASKGCSPKNLLVFATKYGNANIVHHILSDPKIKVNKRDVFGLAAIHYMVEMQKPMMLRTLLYDERHDVNVNVRDKDGKTALHYCAAMGKSIETELMISRLLEHGASIHAKDNIGKTAYDYAIEHNAKHDTRFSEKMLRQLNPAYVK